MAALFSTPGPIELFWKPRIAGTLHSSFLYLGTAVTAPEVEIKPAYIPVMNDLGGRSVPTIHVQDGEQHVVSATINRFDWNVYNQMKSRQTVASSGTITGEGQYRGIIHTGYSDGYFLFVNSYHGVAGGDNGTMPPGRLYYSCKFAGSRESTVGTRVHEIALVLEMNGVLNTSTRKFDLYTENEAAWGSVTVN